MKKLAAILLMILVAVFGVAMAEGAQAGEAAGIRIVRDESARKPAIRPSFSTAVPHTPIRRPR